MSEANTTEIAAVDELIIPGRPEKVAAIKPIMTAVCKLNIGLTPATKANAIDSGIKAKATVRPERKSSFSNFLFSISLCMGLNGIIFLSLINCILPAPFFIYSRKLTQENSIPFFE